MVGVRNLMFVRFAGLAGGGLDPILRLKVRLELALMYVTFDSILLHF